MDASLSRRSVGSELARPSEHARVDGRCTDQQEECRRGERHSWVPFHKARQAGNNPEDGREQERLAEIPQRVERSLTDRLVAGPTPQGKPRFQGSILARLAAHIVRMVRVAGCRNAAGSPSRA